MRIKDVLRSIIPPVIWNFARRLKHLGLSTHGVFEGPYSSWVEAVSQSSGWDSPLIIEKTLNAAIKVRDGQAFVEQDGLVKKQIPYSPAILAFLLIAFAHRKHGVDIIDFGGGLGSNYYQNRKILLQLPAAYIRWRIVEQPTLVKLGTEHFESSDLSFSSSLTDLLSTQSSQTESILFSGSLQYVPDPFSILTQVAESHIKLIALDRVLVSPIPDHEIFVQNPNPNIYYKANYPVWCFSRDKLLKWFSGNGFTLVEHFTHNPDVYFDHCGMIFAR